MYVDEGDEKKKVYERYVCGWKSCVRIKKISVN